MSQSRLHSSMEAGANIVAGILISAALTYWVLPVWGLVPKLHEALEITALFTAASFARQYGLRRVFNHMSKSSRNMNLSSEHVHGKVKL